MTTQKYFAAAAFALIGHAALAQDALPATWANEVPAPVVSSVSREAVRAQVLATRQAGSGAAFDSLAYLQPGAQTGSPMGMLAQVRDGAEQVAAMRSGISRADVKAALEQARRSGELNPFDNLADLNRQAPRHLAVPAALAQAR